MRQSFYSVSSGLILIALLGGAAVWFAQPASVPGAALARSPMDSAIPIHAEDDDPCKPDFRSHVNGIGAGGGGGISGALQAALCPNIQFNMLPLEPRDPCPDPEPCQYPPNPPDEQPPGGGSPGTAGSPFAVPWLPQTADPDPAPLFASDYGEEPLRRSQGLDSPFVDAATGEMSLVEADLFLPGSGLDFFLGRFYHSFLAAYSGQYGAGWELSIHRRVRATIGAGGAPSDLQLVTGGGYPTGKFYPAANNWYTHATRLEQFLYIDPPTGNDQLQLHDPSGLVETYERLDPTDPWFYLVRAETPFGASTTFSYVVDADGPTTRELDSATDSAGRTIEFDYDLNSMFSEVRVKSAGQLIAQINYEYLDPGAGEPFLLKKVTGLEVATDNGAGQVLMQRRVHEYSYVQEGGQWYLKDLKNGTGALEQAWTYEAGSGGRVQSQTDRPGDPSQAGLHAYAYSGNPSTQTTYTGPEGEQRIWSVSGGRITQLAETVDAASGAQAITSYSYDPNCSGCSRVREVIFPDQRKLHIEYDLQGNPVSVWNYAIPGSGLPARVERFSWSSFDPASGKRMIRLLQHEQVRDAETGESPGNSCDKPECGATYGADGWIVHNYIWNPTQEWKLNEIDYGSIESGIAPLAGTIGRKESFSYHANGLVSARRQYEGGQEIARTDFALDAAGRFVASVTIVDTVNGGSWAAAYQRDAFGRVVQTEHEDGRFTRTERDQAGRPWRVVEDWQPGSGSGARTTELRYDREGRLVKQTVTAGSLVSKVELTLDATGRPTAATTTGPGGSPRTTVIAISKSGLLKSVTAWNGVQYGTDFQSGAWRLPTRRWEKYLGANERTVWQAGDGGGDADGYNAMGRLTSFRNAAGWITAVRYDGHGRYKEHFGQTDATHVRGRHINFDARGFVSEVELGMAQGQPSNPTAISWNEHHVLNHNLAGHLLAWALYEGNASTPSRAERYRVDLRGRTETAVRYQGDRAAGIGTAAPVTQDYAWDALDRVLQERQLSSLGGTSLETTDYYFDDLLRTLEVVITGEASVYREKARAQRDALGRLTSITEWEWSGGAWGQSRVFAREWDGLDRQTAAVDPLGKRWEWSYDDLHRTVVELVKPYGQGQILQTVWAYDPGTGALASVTDAEGKVTGYSVFTSGPEFLLPKRTTYPDSRWEEVFGYDALRRPTSLGDSRGVIRSLTWDYGYLIADDSNLETLIANGDQHLAGADKMQWEYDRLTGYPLWSKSLTAGVETWRTESVYNKLGELTSEKQGLPGAQHAFSWVYGLGGEMRSVTYPAGLGLASGTIGRDAAGRVTSVQYSQAGQTLANYSLTFDGLRAKRRLENVSGVQLDYGFDSWNRLTGMTWSKGATTFDGQQRTLDLGNRVIARKRAMDATGEVFSHDGHHRMTSWWQGVQNPLAWNGQADPSTWTEVERYTLNGVYARSNTQRQTNGGTPTTTTYASNNAHFYTQVGSETRNTHHGYLNSDGTFYYKWDAWGRLTEVKEAGTGTIRRTHIYDCEGRRVKEWETEGSTTKTTRYVFWGMGLAASYVDGGEVRTYGFVGGADGESFVKVENAGSGINGTYELARDFQGSFLALIQRTNPASVSVAERYRYEPFGKVSIESASGQPLTSSAVGNERFFMGRVWDKEISLYDVRARWYEPDAGSFISTDPPGFIDSLNLYQYGLAEPQSLSDRFGLQLGDVGEREACDQDMEATRPRGSGEGGLGGDDVASAVAGGVPIVGDIYDLATIISGYDCITGDRLSTWDRVFGACTFWIPGISAGAARGIKKAANSGTDLASDARRQHILDGDETGGGHRAGTGTPGKSEFPADWSDDYTMEQVSDVATDPSSTRVPNPNTNVGGDVVTGTRDGVTISVVVDKNNQIHTAWPHSPRNP